jgi:hypothetical protein
MLHNDKNYGLRPVTDEEARLIYSDSNINSQDAWIGRLRGDFGCRGEEFWHTWFPHSKELQTQQFKDDLQEVVDALRKDGLLKNLTEMEAYCLQHPESKINEDSCPAYGFIVETTEYQFCIRCFPYPGDYQFNIYAYNKISQQLNMEQGNNSLNDGLSMK